MIFFTELHLMPNLFSRKDLSSSHQVRGEITIYLALILGIMLSLILTLVEGARRSAVKMQIECVVDMGLDSIFAEYHRELLRQYDLFFIDTSYGTNLPSLAATENHLVDYMEYNFNPAKFQLVFGARDWLGIRTQLLAISEFSTATDEKGSVVRRQILQYMKDKFFVEDFNRLVKNQSEVTRNHLHETNLQSEKDRNREELNQKINEKEKAENQELVVEVPSDQSNQIRGLSLLPYITEGSTKISRTTVNLPEYISYRDPLKGNGIPYNHQEKNGIMDEFLISEYMLDKCGYYNMEKSEGQLAYQIEYILAGQNNDYGNLSEVANRLLMIREASNMIYLWSDTGKVAEAEAMAVLISTLALVPEAEPALKQLILLTWATAESICDLKAIYKGEKIPMMKTSATWKLSFFQFSNFGAGGTSGTDSSDGLTYKEYLRVLLSLQNTDDKMIRFLDIVEMDIRMTDYNQDFRMDACIDSLTVDALFYSHFGFQYGIRRFYSYG